MADRCFAVAEKKRVFCILMLSVVMLLWGGEQSCRATEMQYGGTLTFGAENEFAGFDVLKARGFAICDAIANNTIQERLFGLDAEGNIRPLLGLSATSAADGKSWTITLRRNVTFHDGTPFNADAVVQHFERILNPKSRYRGRVMMAPVMAVEKVDDFTVRFVLKHPWLPFLKGLTNARGLGMFIPSPKAVAAGTQMRHPVGTGPFMFKEWLSGERFVVVKNPDYWQKGKPYLDRIVFKLLPDHQTRYASLKSGEMNLIWMDRGSLIQQARSHESLKVYQSEGNGAEIFVLNTTKPPFNDVTVRRALAHAWNQAACVKVGYQDAVPTTQTPFGPMLTCANTGYRLFDTQEARRMLANHANPIDVVCLHSNTKRGSDQGVVLQQFAEKAGFRVTPMGLSFAPVVKKVITKEYQISTWRMPSVSDPGPLLFASFHSKSPMNVTGYHNSRMDELLVAQRMEMDAVKRDGFLCDIARLLNEDAPILYRGGRRFYMIARPEVKGIVNFKNGIAQLGAVWIER